MTPLSLPCSSVLATGSQIPFCINSRIFLSRWSINAKKIGLEHVSRMRDVLFAFYETYSCMLKSLADLNF